MTAAVLLLCLLFPSTLHARLVHPGEDGFSECNDFFHQGSPPQGFSHPDNAKICQRYQGDKHYATLYSTQHKIPVYSAFTYQEDAGGAWESWMVEPQVDDSKSSLDEVSKGSDVTEKVPGLGTKQALEEDYASTDYQPGLLYHKASPALTSSVPLMPDFKEKWATDVDQLVKEKFLPHCENGENLHLLAGAVPSDTKINDKVSVPEYVWLAACCSAPDTWSLGVIKRTGDVEGLEQVSVEELENQLSGDVKLFAGQCGGGAVHPELRSTSEASTQTEEEPPVQTPGAFVRFFQFIFSVVYEVIKSVLCLVWFLLKQVFNVILGRLCWIWTAVTTYVFALSKVLLNIPYDVLRVFGNILCGFVRVLDNALSVVCLILRLPTRFLCDMASFPYYTICAIPDVGMDILSGVWGVFMLGFSTVFGAFGGSFSVASFAGSSVFQRFIGQSEGYEN
ncbi:endonuclease domain-containing 1 protein [Hyla sarda]|uniref:endonuclease domain-containing 1 protein n=1 Tax=Hyla sarda TaxID=327740 RepID=UPI0024C27ADB|nr:endonuclease domain-containing 1 protein [Hyla sarda]